jgi:hypothetical protein
MDSTFATGPVVMDLQDFIPEHYELKFKIGGRPYVVSYAEASVDEVFHMIAAKPAEDSEQMVAQHRGIVTRFLSAHLSEGDPDRLAADLELVPYNRPGAPFDVQRLYAELVMRVKKKDPGASPESR